MQRREASGGALGCMLGCDERKGNLEQTPALRLEIVLDPASVAVLAASVGCEGRTAGHRGLARRAGAVDRRRAGGAR